MTEPDLPGRRGAKPLSDLIDREAPRPSLSPNNWQAKLQGRDTAPRIHKIARLAQLHLGRARRMIRDDEVDRAFAQCFPKLFAIFPFADRRTTFELSRAIGNVFRGKMQIMRARFDGNRK